MNEHPEYVGIVIIGLALIALGFLIVAQCNRKYPAPVPGEAKDAQLHPLVIRRVAGGCAFLYSKYFGVLLPFASSVGWDVSGLISYDSEAGVYGVYLQAKHADKIQQMYGV